jgi:hypothetical protein
MLLDQVLEKLFSLQIKLAQMPLNCKRMRVTQNLAKEGKW